MDKFNFDNGGFPPLKYCGKVNNKDNVRLYTPNNNFIPLTLLLKRNDKPLLENIATNDDLLEEIKAI
jgi:hypothetical protein